MIILSLWFWNLSLSSIGIIQQMEKILLMGSSMGALISLYALSEYPIF
ncbi:MAG: hypothetical protein R2865_09220 [Deinococcales bacterium]